MKNGKMYAVILLTAAAISLPGCARVKPVVEAYLERPAATIAPTEIPDAEAIELRTESIDLSTDEPEETVFPTPVLRAQETSPPQMIAPVVAPTARPTETKTYAAETAAPMIAPVITDAPKPPATPVAAEIPKPAATPPATEMPRPTATPVVTESPKPTSTPKPTSAPVPTATPTPSATPAPTASPKPTAAPTPTPLPTPTPHVHDWTMHEATGHYESQKVGTEEVAVGTYWEEIGGWDESRSAYYRCNDCGAEFASNLEAGEHILAEYHSSYSYYPAEIIHHDGEWVERTRYEAREVYENIWITDSEQYWTCLCGETRYSQP